MQPAYLAKKHGDFLELILAEIPLKGETTPFFPETFSFFL